MNILKKSCFNQRSMNAFSLVEVVLALAICAFGVISLVGLFGTGLQASRESQDQIQAANLASLLISTRTASPTNHIEGFSIPESFMTNAYQNVYATPVPIGYDGKLLSKKNSFYHLTCSAGTNQMTGSQVSQVYLMLTWPPPPNSTNTNMRHYELMAYIPFR